MEFHDNENLVRYDMSHTSRIDSILLEPPASSPPVPVQVQKPGSCHIPDFESVNFSVISDASEFDNAVFANNAKNAVVRNYLPSSTFNNLSSNSTLSSFNARPTSSVRPKTKNYVREVHGPASSKLQQYADEASFNSNINGTSPQGRIQNLGSPKINQFSDNSPKNCVLDNNGEYPKYNMQYEMHSPFSSGYQNVNVASNNVENLKTCEQEIVVKTNVLNHSDSVTLLPQQLHFYESNNVMDDYINTGNTSSSKHMSEDNLSPLHPMKMYKKLRKHHSLDEGVEKSVCLQYPQESQPLHSGIFTTAGLGSINMNAKENVPRDIWTLIHEQNEKIKQLQNQLFAIQQQNNSVAVSKQETLIQSSEDKKIEMINKNVNSILQYLTEHNGTIHTLMDQVSVLAKRTDELESKNKNNISEPLDFSSAGASSSTKAPNESNSKDDLMRHNETHVKKTSSSTMTSVTLDGNEKLLFCKTTVVTENCQKDLLRQGSFNKNPPNSTQLNNSQNHSFEVASNEFSKCTTPRSLDSKKLKKKSKETVKSNRGCENVTPNGEHNSPVAPSVRVRTSNHKNPSPLSDSNKANTEADLRLVPEERNLSNFERIVRNIDNLVLRNDEEEESSEKHCSSCCCTETNNFPGTVTCATKRKSRTQKNSGACAHSSTSEDSDYASPHWGWVEDDAAAKKKYGITPSLLSVDTQLYLEKHNLCDNWKKCSSKQSRSPHVRQQLR